MTASSSTPAVKALSDRAAGDRSALGGGDIAAEEVEMRFGCNKVALHPGPALIMPLILADRASTVSSPKAAAAKGSSSREARRPGRSSEKWNDNDVVMMVRNPDYWNKELPHPRRPDLRIITDLNIGLVLAIAGENHFAYRLKPAVLVKTVPRRHGRRPVPTIAGSPSGLQPSAPCAPLNNAAGRQVIN